MFTDYKITERSTKAQMLEALVGKSTEAIQLAGINASLRLRISVLEGTRALGLKPQPKNNVVVLRGVPHNVIVERHGARVTKRFVPVAPADDDRDLAHEADMRELYREQLRADFGED